MQKPNGVSSRPHREHKAQCRILWTARFEPEEVPAVDGVSLVSMVFGKRVARICTHGLRIGLASTADGENVKRVVRKPQTEDPEASIARMEQLTFALHKAAAGCGYKKAETGCVTFLVEPRDVRQHDLIPEMPLEGILDLGLRPTDVYAQVVAFHDKIIRTALAAMGSEVSLKT